MRVGILKCGQSPEVIRGDVGDYDDMFVRLLAGRGFEFDSYHVEAMQFPESIHAADAWLLTGSRHGVYEDHPFIPPLADFIRAAHAEGVPLVGICFGHQMIAQALGGVVTRHPDGWAVGAQEYDFDGQPVTFNAWHRDQVVQPPAGATVIATNDFCRNAALVYGDGALTVQAHPEFDDDMIDGLIEHRGGAVPGPLLETARARRGTADSRPIADLIAKFLTDSRNRIRSDAAAGSGDAPPAASPLAGVGPGSATDPHPALR